MLKREHDLNDREALLVSGWVNNYPELGLAYRLKEDFFKIYDARSKEEALARFAAWDRAVTHEVRDAFSDLIKAWRNWQPYILAYFDHPVTNAYTESLNSLIRVMNRLGRGYSWENPRCRRFEACTARHFADCAGSNPVHATHSKLRECDSSDDAGTAPETGFAGPG